MTAASIDLIGGPKVLRYGDQPDPVNLAESGWKAWGVHKRMRAFRVIVLGRYSGVR